MISAAASQQSVAFHSQRVIYLWQGGMGSGSVGGLDESLEGLQKVAADATLYQTSQFDDHRSGLR